MKISKLLGGLALAAILTAGCGTKNDATLAASPTTEATEATTTTIFVAPTTTTIDPERVAMAVWAGAHSGDMGAINTALGKVQVIAHQIATTAGNNVDNFTATNSAAQLMAGADKVIALMEQEKKACLGVATAVKAAQKGLPIPVDSVNETYSSALDHYLSAARACQVEKTSDAATEIAAGNDDVAATTQALKDYAG